MSTSIILSIVKSISKIYMYTLVHFVFKVYVAKNLFYQKSVLYTYIVKDKFYNTIFTSLYVFLDNIGFNHRENMVKHTFVLSIFIDKFYS